MATPRAPGPRYPRRNFFTTRPAAPAESETYMAKDEKPKAEATPEEACTISDEEMMLLPRKAYCNNDRNMLRSREERVKGFIEVKKSKSGQYAEVDWNLFNRALSAAQKVARAYVELVYPNGLHGDPIRMSEGERRALGSGYVSEPTLGNQFALDQLADLIHDLFYINCHAGQLMVHGNVLLSRSTMKHIPQD